jgi:hypothetical protein
VICDNEILYPPYAEHQHWTVDDFDVVRIAP